MFEYSLGKIFRHIQSDLCFSVVGRKDPNATAGHLSDGGEPAQPPGRLHRSILNDFNSRDFGFAGPPNAMPAVRMLFEKCNVGSDDALDVWRQLLQLAALIACGHRTTP
jgi:hypothetical protein